MAGIVYVGEEKSDKPGNMIDENAHVEVRGHDIGYVSRGEMCIRDRDWAFRFRRVPFFQKKQLNVLLRLSQK